MVFLEGEESEQDELQQLASNAPMLSKGLLTLACELDELEAMLFTLQMSTEGPALDSVGTEPDETALASSSWPEIPEKHLLGFGCAGARPPSSKALAQGVMVQQVSSGRWGCPATLYAISGGPVPAAEPTNPRLTPVYTCCAHAHAVTRSDARAGGEGHCQPRAATSVSAAHTGSSACSTTLSTATTLVAAGLAAVLCGDVALTAEELFGAAMEYAVCAGTHGSKVGRGGREGSAGGRWSGVDRHRPSLDRRTAWATCHTAARTHACGVAPSPPQRVRCAALPTLTFVRTFVRLLACCPILFESN
jgi:hypothetical protein